MTDVLIDRADSGEIPRLPGETRTRIHAADLGEPTQRIDPRLIKAPSFDAIPRKVFDLDDTVTYLPQTIGVVPDPETERLTLPDTVARLDGELRPAPLAPEVLLRRSVPYVLPADRAPWDRPRHARPAPLWARAALVVGGAMAAGSGLGLAILWAVVH